MDTRWPDVRKHARRALRRLAAMLAGLCLLAAAGPAGAQQAPLRMALIPYLSPNVLVPLFQPLAQSVD